MKKSPPGDFFLPTIFCSRLFSAYMYYKNSAICAVGIINIKYYIQNPSVRVIRHCKLICESKL